MTQTRQRYAARGGPLRGYGGPLYAARGGPLRGYGGPPRDSRRAATRLWRAGRYAAPRGGPQTTTRPRRGAATRHKYTIPVQSYFMKPRTDLLSYLITNLSI